MRSLGVAVKKNEIWYSLLEGKNKDEAKVVEINKKKFNSDVAETDLVLDFYNTFDELLTEYKPDVVVYKMSLKMKLPQIAYMYFSLAMLNFICKQKGINTICRSSSWISAKKKNECKAKFLDLGANEDRVSTATIAWSSFGK